jgi:hypothetical protein
MKAVQTAVVPALTILLAMKLMSGSAPQALVIDSGSTNRPGITITVDESGGATAQPRNGESKPLNLDPQLCQALMKDIKAAGQLSALPEHHCPKSVSFGSSLYVEVNGHRSPDLSCANPPDARMAALQKDANDILEAVRAQLGPMRVRPVRPVKPSQ